MSYYTAVEFHYFGEDDFDLDDVARALPAVLDNMSVSHDVMDDLRTLLHTSTASVQLYAEDVIQIFAQLAKMDPEVSFIIRGFGESPLDVWLREFRDGAVALAQGPPPNAI